MKKVIIEVLEHTYDVYIGDCIAKIGDFIKENQKVVIITDDTVKNLHLERLKKELVVDTYIYSLGENAEISKSLTIYEDCVRFCLDHYLDRDIVVIAFGGGAVGDFAGFFASTYKRGVKFINIPTTLLAHDSAIGGKTALNYHNIKNVIGNFYQPEVVIYHLEFLKTLQRIDVISGFGEVFKHDLLNDSYLLNEIIEVDANLHELILNEDLMEEILYRCILVKKVYIESDIYDKLGRRQYLNFGHTLAHAIEILFDYSHGEAVSLGMCFDLFISENEIYKNFYDRLKNYGYFKQKLDFNIEDIIKIMKNDKKNNQGNFKFIGLKGIGRPYEISLTTNAVIDFLTRFKMVIKWDFTEN